MRKLLFLLILLLVACSSIHGQQDTYNTEKFEILFIGNSLTYTNNLPQLIKTYAKRKGLKINTKMVAFPNYAIEDHWNDGQIQKLISSKNYDFVILQQGPSSQNDGREMLIEFGKKYSSLCKSNNAKLCYFMVWPSLTYYHSFDNVIKNYTDAASVNNSILLPVGKVWKDYVDSTNNTEYYGSDGFHPSIKGSQISAKVILEHLFQH